MMTAQARLDFIGAAISIGFLAIAALVFWLCTTQIWHLPAPRITTLDRYRPPLVRFQNTVATSTMW